MRLSRADIGFLLADVSHLMRRAMARRLNGSTLTFAQARAMVHLSRHEGIRQVELANLLEVQPITLARLLDQLDERDLIERRPDPADRRAHRLFLTAAAAPHLASLRQVAAAVRADVLRDIDDQEATIMLGVLAKMRDNLAALTAAAAARDP
ncbi:MAG: MarR family transcriptional regulator [Bordetella sp. SCN 67-23]|nr:MAG: MarR family transcriptional regulator [Bordetella sp. SCN 67-23]